MIKNNLDVLGIDTSLGVVDIAAYKLTSKHIKQLKTVLTLPKPVHTEYIKKDDYQIHIEKHLPKAVQRTIKKLGKTPDLVAINLGPGSYTSLRSGLAFVKGWWQSLAETNKPRFEVVGVKGLPAILETVTTFLTTTKEDNKEEKKQIIAAQEERNNRVWYNNLQLIDRKEWDKKFANKAKYLIVLRTLPKQSSTVIITTNNKEQKIAMGQIISYIGIRKYLRGEVDNPLKLLPEYGK